MASCAGCKHWKATVPSAWKEDGPYDVFSPILYMREKNAILPGYCTLDAVWTPAAADHYCGHFKPEWDRNYRFREEIYGPWERRELEKERAETTKLRRQLKEARRISAARLKRLQNLP